VLENEIAGASLNAGAIGLQSEIAPVEYRNIRIAPLPPDKQPARGRFPERAQARCLPNIPTVVARRRPPDRLLM